VHATALDHSAVLLCATCTCVHEQLDVSLRTKLTHSLDILAYTHNTQHNLTILLVHRTTLAACTMKGEAYSKTTGKQHAGSNDPLSRVLLLPATILGCAMKLVLALTE
jgi:hypothetical protein